jgi:hypothetical protein
MSATLRAEDPAPRLRAGVQSSIAAADNDWRTAVEMELIAVLDGASFRGSARSRAFLRFVTEETLAGRGDSLKERTIGAAVLGRDAAYDTGSDPAVRVRANDVRKRLAAHYSQSGAKAGWRIELTAGCYVPQFVHVEPEAPKPRVHRPPPMLLRQLAAPTLVALFITLGVIRARVDTHDSFTAFWSKVLVNHRSILVEVDPAADGVSISPEMAEAAMWFSTVAASFEMPIRIGVGEERAGSDICVIRLTTRRPISTPRAVRIGETTMAAGSGADVLLFSENPGDLQRAVRRLSSREDFPAASSAAFANH